MGGEIRAASPGRFQRLLPSLLESGVYPDVAQARAAWRAEPWRIGTTGAGEVALTRRHSHLPLLLIERLWCEEARLPALVEGVAEVARQVGCARLLSPFLDEAEALAYERAGLSTYREIVASTLEVSCAFPQPAYDVHAASFDAHEQVLALDAEVFEPFWRFDAEWMARSEPGGRLATVREADELAGYAISRLSGKDAHIVRLAVRSRDRRRGLGAALLADALGFVAGAGATSVTVNTQVENDAARALYGSVGFVESPERLRILISDTL